VATFFASLSTSALKPERSEQRGWQETYGLRGRSVTCAGNSNNGRHHVSAALQGAGFAFDAADTSIAWARDEGQHAVWHLPYANELGAGQGLRPAIKVELNSDAAEVAALARSIAEADARQFAHQYPAYAAEIASDRP
jgi:hypothetical protein